MSKKGGGVRPIAVGYVLRHLAAKYANSHVIEQRSRALQPRQVGVGVAGGAKRPFMPCAVTSINSHLAMQSSSSISLMLSTASGAIFSLTR